MVATRLAFGLIAATTIPIAVVTIPIVSLTVSSISLKVSLVRSNHCGKAIFIAYEVIQEFDDLLAAYLDLLPQRMNHHRQPLKFAFF